MIKMDKKYIAIGGNLIGLAIIALLAFYVPGFTDNTYYCEDEGKLRECLHGISGGLETRCYDNENHSGWDYCSSGWIKAKEYIKLNKTEVEIPEEVQKFKVFANGELYTCSFKGLVESYTKCISPKEREAYLGELVIFMPLIS